MGVSATLRNTHPAPARPGVTAVRLQNSEAAGEDFKRIVLKNVEGSVDIH
jgi:hypothetical protein